MNDKDIDIWKEKTKCIFHITEYRRFWNYITNLQEENEKLEKEQLITNMAYETVLNFYKSRNEKAIEYIHNHQPVFELSNKKQIQEWFEKLYYIELLNILNGGDK